MFPGPGNIFLAIFQTVLYGTIQYNTQTSVPVPNNSYKYKNPLTPKGRDVDALLLINISLQTAGIYAKLQTISLKTCFENALSSI